ncbi:ATP-binding cassette sub-family A member 3-like isoform X1 [Canis lupus familiaris]|uniref:ATP-binding cassette sub-family A member 3-like isoform X1 n=1 Tax=Canis lupus familiaris TaxID=9615 RepID=UPI0018F2ED0F|nr:ATP-binding cassette sub-family A member 3-like isoform X1 [Canis lupus familiaris]XP_038396029.1 ATP-binding cassette sub-family A member 3-like isoform X1 [Canis lupus familiaris]XP_038396030.1 ATP-binding cassette sub-family A member 3-like isoform X1 [Canis lupus familiaris]XP_038401065.1 ATP-binding cassette sub-family A member 3-like isoform X1 [Canis lupus familiaris]XP_038524832.1 ATP-binding cassette sub-family A member 3-like isoform X1 [Canis lupus familiaris]XP_038524833.1 ATP-b
MDFSWFYKFMALLWKNFILKRRRLMALFMEFVLTLIFAGTLLLTRKLLIIRNYGPFNYSLQPVDELPAFLEVPMIFPGAWELAFVPSKSVVVKGIVELVKRDLQYNFSVQGFSSERKFEEYVKQENNSKKVLVGIIFDHKFQNSNDPLPFKVKYSLRFSGFQRNKYVSFFRTGGWETGVLFPTFPSLGPRSERNSNGGPPGYITEGFLVMQHALDRAIMKYYNHTATRKLFQDVTVFVQRFPYPAYSHDYFFTFFGIFIPLVILFIFSMNHLTLTQAIVWEKENRLKEYLLMIGLNNWMLWAACFFTFLSLYSVIILLMCMIFFVKIDPAPIIQYSDPSLIFIFLLCFAIATIFFSFMVSTFFNKAHFAVSVGGFIYFATYFPFATISTNFGQMTFTQKLASCLSSNIAMALGTKFLVKAEMEKIGIKWSNIISPPKMEDFDFIHVLGMFLFDAFLYGLVAWYIEAVFPGEYGIPKPWNFFLLRSHWFGETPERKKETRQFYETNESKYFEAEPTNLVAGIQIKHLYKEFQVQNTTKIALKDLSLNLYMGQITVLLGHNGAGKSTTLSILSGLYPATSGEAYINGYNISQQMVHIRKSLGVCPQQNLLFDYLTVSEHLYFYCVVKGIPQKTRLMETDHMLAAFNLLDKHNAFSHSLSGGMKRRLSMIIALIGGSKVVILDEPTSGMDPASRRATWEVLQQYKENRTILLTTHYMDEADILGDRIAIMVKGSLRCCGSSVFLKRIYGVGYHIVMVKEAHCNVEEIFKLLQYYIPTATLEKNVSNEVSFILPKEYTHSFEALFTDLEKRRYELGIASFGASVTTMEEVFFRVSNMEDSQTDIQATQTLPLSVMSEVSIKNQNRNMSNNKRADYSSMNENPAIMFNTGYSLYHQQFWAMFIKRAMFSWRNWKLILLQMLALLGSFIFLSEADKLSYNINEKAREMNLDQYGRTIVPLYISGNSSLALIFLKHLRSILESDKHTLKEVQGDLLKYLMENEDCIHLCIVAFSIEVKTNKIILTALFNNQAYHSPSLALAILDNILFMTVAGSNASITIFNKPQPYSKPKKQSGTLSDGLQVALNLHFGMTLLISGFCLLTVTEQVTKAKHIQFLSGVYIPVYWLSALLWDFILFFITCCLLLGAFKFCQLDIYITDYHFLDTMLIFMLYGWSAIPLMYLLSFLFTKSTSAYIKLVLFNYLSGIFSTLIDATLQFGKEVQHRISRATRDFILNSLLFFPNYNLAKCINDYFTFYQIKKWCSGNKPPVYLNCSTENIAKNVYSLEEKMIGKYMIIMSIIGFIYLLFLFFLDTTLWKLRTFFNQYVYFGIYKTFKKRKVSKELSGESDDEDVQNERQRILGQPQKELDSTVLIKELTKIYFKYPVVLAVKNISVTIQRGECFGLLGFNGAGKTTTFKILTGEETVTTGDVFIEHFSITKSLQKVKSRVGYCPQSDALLEYMTGREIMIMYARSWGVSEPQIQLYVNRWLSSMQLEPHADKLIGTYSGGTKRRLSTAIALMGKSSVILLDEPSAGMDPEARRLLWDAVTRTRESGKAIIITSHRMEECDAFCTRLAIMVQGKFLCLGSPQHLKNKFGNIYILKVKVKNDVQDKLEDLKYFITLTFPGSALKQENQGILTYYIPSKDSSWGKVFGILEEAKEQFHLEDYSISQITLEQVFLNFANPENTEGDYNEKKERRRRNEGERETECSFSGLVRAHGVSHQPHEKSDHSRDSWADEQTSRDNCCPVARQKEFMKLLYFDMFVQSFCILNWIL